MSLTQERLKQILLYDPETGLFHWRIDMRGPMKAGRQAGHLHSLGYILIRIKRKDYRAAHLAWLWMTGEWPKAEIDHIDRDKTNNCFTNLREATRQENCRNRSLHKNNKSRLKGVSPARRGKYRARIRVDGKEIFIGLFANAADAHAAYVARARQLFGPFGVTT